MTIDLLRPQTSLVWFKFYCDLWDRSSSEMAPWKTTFLRFYEVKCLLAKTGIYTGCGDPVRN